MGILKKIFKQTSWQILGKVVTSLSTFLALGIIARNYQEAGVGVFTLATTYLAMFFQLVDFGFNAHLLKKVTAGPRRGGQQVTDEWQRLFGTRLIWSVCLVILAIGLLPFWPFTTPLFAQAVIFGSLAIVGFGIFTSANLVFQSRLSYERVILASSIGSVIFLGLIFWWTSLKLSISTLVFAQTIQWLTVGLIAVFLLKKFVTKLTPLFDLQYGIKLIKDSWPIAATLGLNIIYFRADTFIVSFYHGTAQSGVYNVAYSVFQTILVLPSLIMNSYYPLMLESLKNQAEKFRKQIILALLSLFGLSFVITLSTFYLSPLTIKILTGSGFEGSLQSLKILSLGFPAFFTTALLIWLMIARGKYKLTLLIYTIGLVFNLLSNLIFVPQYSFYASSWITVLSEYLILSLQIVVLAFL